MPFNPLLTHKSPGGNSLAFFSLLSQSQTLLNSYSTWCFTNVHDHMLLLSQLNYSIFDEHTTITKPAQLLTLSWSHTSYSVSSNYSNFSWSHITTQPAQLLTFFMITYNLLSQLELLNRSWSHAWTKSAQLLMRFHDHMLNPEPAQLLNTFTITYSAQASSTTKSFTITYLWLSAQLLDEFTITCLWLSAQLLVLSRSHTFGGQLNYLCFHDHIAFHCQLSY